MLRSLTAVLTSWINDPSDPDLEESIQWQVLVIWTQPINKHVGTSLHLETYPSLSELFLRDHHAFFLPDKEWLAITVFVFEHFLADSTTCEQQVSHLHAVSALVNRSWLTCMALTVLRRVISFPEKWWELCLISLLPQFGLFLLQDILNALVDLIKFIVFSNDHQRVHLATMVAPLALLIQVRVDLVMQLLELPL